MNALIIADTSFLTKIAALTIALVVMVRMMKAGRFGEGVISEETNELPEDERPLDATAWCRVIATLTESDVWLLERGLKVVTGSRTDGNWKGKHLLDVLENENARETLALIASLNEDGGMARSGALQAVRVGSAMMLTIHRERK